HFSQFVGYQNITSQKYLATVGEEKAAQHPIGTGPWQHVEGKQGDFHRFQAVSNHWRQPPGFKELLIRRIPEPATRLSGIRAGEIHGFEITVNPMVFTYALDGPDVMEAVALDWEKLGIKVKRAPVDFGNFLPKVRARKTGPTSWTYASPPFEEPALAWQRAIW